MKHLRIHGCSTFIGDQEVVDVGEVLVGSQPLNPTVIGVLSQLNPEVLQELDPYLDYSPESGEEEMYLTEEEFEALQEAGITGEEGEVYEE